MVRLCLLCKPKFALLHYLALLIHKLIKSTAIQTLKHSLPQESKQKRKFPTVPNKCLSFGFCAPKQTAISSKQNGPACFKNYAYLQATEGNLFAFLPPWFKIEDISSGMIINDPITFLAWFLVIIHLDRKSYLPELHIYCIELNRVFPQIHRQTTKQEEMKPRKTAQPSDSFMIFESARSHKTCQIA